MHCKIDSHHVLQSTPNFLQVGLHPEPKTSVTENCFAWMQKIKKNRDPRWEEEFQFMLEEPPVNDRMHVEVMSRPSSIGLHPKV